jgi:hypothetical protein
MAANIDVDEHVGRLVTMLVERYGLEHELPAATAAIIDAFMVGVEFERERTGSTSEHVT